jgi:hypothetical protein
MDIFTQSAEKAHPLSRLCGQVPEDRMVGYIFKMSYDRVQVLSNDYFRERVYGIPQNAILIAASFDPADISAEPNLSRFVLAMRVRGPAPLNDDAERVSAIIEHHRSKTSADPSGPLDGMDAFTHAHLQVAGLECKVLGSFYEDSDGHLAYGADIEDYFSVAPMRVFKPAGEALRMIANYCDPNRRKNARDETLNMGFIQAPEAFEFGRLRYTSTNRLQHSDGTDVPVALETADVLAKRCGVFGMTRTGKSNMVKTLVGSIALSTMQAGGRLGQLILDLNGEYANANQQDAGAIGEVFSDNVVRYRTRNPTGLFFDLRPNFYQSFNTGLDTLREALKADGALSGADIKGFMEMELDATAPKDPSDLRRWRVKVAAYRCLLHAANYPTSAQDDGVIFEVGSKVLNQAYKALKMGAATNEDRRVAEFRDLYGDPSSGMQLQKARTLLAKLREAEIILRSEDTAENIGLRSSSGNAWMDEAVLGMLNLMVGRNKSNSPINSINLLSRYRTNHSVSGSDDPPGDIHKHLSKGRIVIVDLSLSRPSERTELMERIALGLFQANT